MGKTVAFILAGGRGKRMDVLCHIRPKPALPFAGRYRVIDFTLSNCIYSGINDIAILTDYQRVSMGKYLRQWGSTNATGTFDILEPKTVSYKGTADAVYQNLAYLKNLKAENVLILAGDHIYKMDYCDMLAYHQETGAVATVGVIKVPIEEAYRFGTVSLGNSGEIVNFVEKSSYPASNLASMGIYIFNIRVLAQYLQEDALRPDSSHDFGYSILPSLVGREKVNAYEFTGYWQDIGTPQAYYNANMELIRAQPSFSLNHTRTVLTQRLNLPSPRLYPQAVVINSLISPGCVVKGRVENSILSPGVLVEEQAEVRNSVLMSDTSIGYHSVVDTCIVDEGVRIGKLCYIGFGKSLLSGDFDVTVIGRGVTVPSHTAIGRNCTVFPHVDMSRFRTNLLASSTVVSQHEVARKSFATEKAERNECKSVHIA